MRMLTPAACCLATLVVFSFAFGALAPGAIQIGMIALGSFLAGATTGPVPAVAIDVVHPALRSTAGSMVATVQNLFGLAVGPLISGALSDAFGLQAAMAIVPISCGLAAVLLMIGARSYPADRAAVANLEVHTDIADAVPVAA
jgi:MFS family permease